MANGGTIEIDVELTGTKDIRDGLGSIGEAGKKLAEKALAGGVERIVFDRNGYIYHGKVKALAEGAREGGLKF